MVSDQNGEWHEQLLNKLEGIERHVVNLNDRSIINAHRIKWIERLVRQIECCCFVFVITGAIGLVSYAINRVIL